LAYRNLQQESYGEDWERQLKALEGNEEEIKRLRKQQRSIFNAKLAAMLKLKAEKRPITSLLDIENDVETSDEKLETFCADWVKNEIDEAAWRALSEGERQKMILQARISHIIDANY
jgi:hypothetical protein